MNRKTGLYLLLCACLTTPSCAALRQSDGPPLFDALAAMDQPRVERLLKEGADPNAPLKSGHAATAWAATMDNPQFLQTVLKYGGNPSVVNTSDNVRPTPMFMAISRLQQRNVEVLIGVGADINFARAAGHETPMMAAAAVNQWNIVYSILAAGGDHTIKNTWGNTVSYYVENNNIVAGTELLAWRDKVVTFLRAKGVSVNPKPALAAGGS